MVAKTRNKKKTKQSPFVMSVITKGSVWFCPPIILAFSARIFCIDCKHVNPYNDMWTNVHLFKFLSPKNFFKAGMLSKRQTSGVSEMCIRVQVKIVLWTRFQYHFSMDILFKSPVNLLKFSVVLYINESF